MSMYSMESQLAGDIQRAMRKPLEVLCASLVSGEGLEQSREKFLEQLSQAVGRSIAKGIEEITGPCISPAWPCYQSRQAGGASVSAVGNVGKFLGDGIG